MADDPKILDATKIQAAKAAYDDYVNSLKKGVETGTVSAATLQTLKDRFTGVADAAAFAKTKLSGMMDNVLGSLPGFKNLAGGLEGVNGLLEKFGLAALGIGTEKGRALINPIAESDKVIGAFSTNLAAANATLREMVGVQNTARTAVVMMGGGLAEGDAAASKYPQTLRNMAAMLSISTKELHGMSKALQDVPGMMNAVSGSMTGIGNLAGVTVAPMAVLATVMRKFGIDSEAAAAFGRRGLYEFGQQAEQTFKQLGLITSAQEQTGISGKVVTEQIEQASKGLAIFGQGIAVAASTWTTFQTALKGTGVPIGEIGQMVTQLTSSFANMQLQTKAAISTFSGMGGGRTALGGALQMEMNLRTPGGLEKNLEMMTSTLGKFAGGRIITLEQAASNPQLEAQFVVQRNMLKQLTGISNTEQQNRILETMQNVQRGGMSQVEGGKTLQDAFEKGKDLQTQQVTAIDKGVQILQAAIGGAADKAVEGIQRALLTGTASPRERETGAAKALSLIGKGVATGDKDQITAGYDTATDAMKELLRIGKNLFDVSKPEKKGGSTMDIGGWGLDYVLGRKGALRASGVGMENLPPEAKLAQRPAYAAIPPEILAAITKPSEGPLYRIVGALQKSDDTKMKLMEQMLASLQQKAAAREMPFVAGEPIPRRSALPAVEEAGGEGGSVITVKIVGDEEKVKQIVEEALARRSLWPLAHTE